MLVPATSAPLRLTVAKVVPVATSMTPKAVSLAELSVQFSLMLLEVGSVAASPDGAAGGVASATVSTALEFYHGEAGLPGWLDSDPTLTADQTRLVDVAMVVETPVAETTPVP